jgi:carbon-monoxide dehydrogenase small subunit
MNTLSLRVNARDHAVTVEPRTHLADCLRDDLLLTGTHLGCEHGVCGACTLMVDGRPVRSCLTLTATCAGAEIRTIEGFDDDPLMAALRAAFSRHHALQCGYCTPGMLVTAYDIVRRLPQADEARIRAELAGNLCRCTGYRGIARAIADVLANPPPARVQPSTRSATASPSVLPRTASAGTDVMSQPAGRPAGPITVAGPITLEGGIVLARSIRLDVSAGRIWCLLRSVEQVARLLPGAAVTSVQDEQVSGTVSAAIGPMRATFAGHAVVRFDDAAQTGSVTGTGLDRWTRSPIQGALSFRVVSSGGAACSVEAELRYRLAGPLAQFGRPAIVEGVVDQVLERFSANLLNAASGRTVDAEPVGGIGTIFAVLARSLRRLFKRG